jgi:serine protease
MQTTEKRQSSPQDAAPEETLPGEGQPSPWEKPEPSSFVVIKFRDDTGVWLEEGEFKAPPENALPELQEELDLLNHTLLPQSGVMDPHRLFSRPVEELQAERREYSDAPSFEPAQDPNYDPRDKPDGPEPAPEQAPPEVVEALRYVAWYEDPETARLERFPDLTQYFAVMVAPGDQGYLVDQLRTQIRSVEAAYTAPLPAPPPSPQLFRDQTQIYLNRSDLPNPDSIGAVHAWEEPGGLGDLVTIAVVDYHWNAAHEDLPAAQILESSDPHLVPSNTSLEARNHGTAVLGVLQAVHDDRGMHGIVPEATVRLYAAHAAMWPDINVSDAISRATAELAPGDVILLEQQTYAADGYKVAVEYDLDVFNAIQAATKKGIIVVEAAGNSGRSLDLYPSRFSRDSGAIVVGAGEPAQGFPLDPTSRSRYGPSNYGARVDVQAWGHHVGSLGYGDLTPGVQAEGMLYTADFTGTSSASAIVAGAGAALQSICRATGRGNRAPTAMRQLLIDTGTPQQGNTAEHIGPLPNLWAAIAAL